MLRGFVRRDYIVNYPNGKFAQEASQKITQFIKDESESNHLKKVLDSNKLSELEDFLIIYPNSNCIQEIKLKIQKIKEHDGAWKLANTLKTIKSYQNYINSYPKGEHIDIARSEVQRLAWHQIKESKQSSVGSEPNQIKGSKNKLYNIFGVGWLILIFILCLIGTIYFASFWW